MPPLRVSEHARVRTSPCATGGNLPNSWQSRTCQPNAKTKEIAPTKSASCAFHIEQVVVIPVQSENEVCWGRLYHLLSTTMGTCQLSLKLGIVRRFVPNDIASWRGLDTTSLTACPFLVRPPHPREIPHSSKSCCGGNTVQTPLQYAIKLS